MYQKYAESKKWNFEIMSLSETGLKGIKEFIGSISGKGVYAKLKFESGVHRVQRVPLTESSGRLHTSAATVAILPEADEVDIKIEIKDYSRPGKEKPYKVFLQDQFCIYFHKQQKPVLLA